MTGPGWTPAEVVSDAPGQWVYTALSEANCCVDLGCMTPFSDTLAGALFGTNLGHFVLYLDAAAVTRLECGHVGFLLRRCASSCLFVKRARGIFSLSHGM